MGLADLLRIEYWVSTYAQFVAYDGFLLVREGAAAYNELHELFHHLANAVSRVANLSYKMLQALILARATDLEIILQIMLWDNARHLEEIVCVDGVVGAFETIAGLQSGYGSSHISAGYFYNGLVCIWINVYVFLHADVLQSCNDLRLAQRLESKLGATRRNGHNDARHIVADEAEAGAATLLLHGATQRSLRRMCHRVSLVQHNDLEGRTRPTIGSHAARRKLCKILDLGAHHINAALVRGIQLQYAIAVHVAKDLTSRCENRAGFACAGRAVEQHVR